jgi:hypothetical protein
LYVLITYGLRRYLRARLQVPPDSVSSKGEQDSRDLLEV